MTTRRDFLAATLAAASLAAMPAGAARRKPAKPVERKPGDPMSILVLGGTGFLGPHFVEAARAKGHKLTLFNRGKTNPERFAGDQYDDIEQLQGDRKTDMKALEGPAQMGRGARHLRLHPRRRRAFDQAARRSRRPVPAGLDDLRLREDGHAEPGRERAAGAARESERHRSHRRNLRRPQGAVRSRRAEADAGQGHDRAARA